MVDVEEVDEVVDGVEVEVVDEVEVVNSVDEVDIVLLLSRLLVSVCVSLETVNTFLLGQ